MNFDPNKTQHGIKFRDILSLSGISIGVCDPSNVDERSLKISGPYPFIIFDGKYKGDFCLDNVTFEVEAQRRFDIDDMSIENAGLYVIPKGSKIGYRIFHTQVLAAKKKGFSYIECYAFGEKSNSHEFNGYITWAKLGFEMVRKDERDLFISTLTEFQSGYKLIGLHNDLISQGFADVSITDIGACLAAKNVNELVTTKLGSEIWKLIGFSWYAKFTLEDGSDSWKIFNRYLATRLN